MTTYEYLSIPAGVAAEVRIRDDAGQRRQAFVDDEGDAPLRCCLRRSQVGESLMLVSYAPLRRWAAEAGAEPGAYDEVGPVFIHAQPCDGHVDGTFPAEVLSSQRVFRAYDKQGHIVGGFRVNPAPEHAHLVAEKALDDLFADPVIELVHVRAIEHGCFLAEVPRPS